jgi:hypothetical protein
MRIFTSRCILASSTCITALALLVACGPSDAPSDVVGKEKIEQLRVGMSRDSVLAVFGNGVLSPADASDTARLVRGFRSERHLIDGVAMQVLWYREQTGSVQESINPNLESPVLLQGDTVIAAGWRDYDEASRKWKLPNAYREAQGRTQQ